MSNLEQRIEVEGALSKVSESAREFGKKFYPFATTEIFVWDRVEKLKEQFPLICELAEAGLLQVVVDLSAPRHDQEYHNWKKFFKNPP